MDCQIKGCEQPAENTYTYSGDPKPTSLMTEKMVTMIPLCPEHSKSRPPTFSLEDLK